MPLVDPNLKSRKCMRVVDFVLMPTNFGMHS